MSRACAGGLVPVAVGDAPALDGQRFLIARPAASTETMPLEIVLNPLR